MRNRKVDITFALGGNRFKTTWSFFEDARKDMAVNAYLIGRIEDSILECVVQHFELLREESDAQGSSTQIIDGIHVNPELPAEFDNTPNEARPKSHMVWWGVPFIVSHTDDHPRFLEHWKSGTRWDVRCLDGGAWDRSTCWGQYGSLEEAVKAAKSGKGSFVSYPEGMTGAASIETTDDPVAAALKASKMIREEVEKSTPDCSASIIVTAVDEATGHELFEGFIWRDGKQAFSAKCKTIDEAVSALRDWMKGIVIV